MKRLLAYLFLVLGFGLTFSVNAKAGDPTINVVLCSTKNNDKGIIFAAWDREDKKSIYYGDNEFNEEMCSALGYPKIVNWENFPENNKIICYRKTFTFRNPVFQPSYAKNCEQFGNYNQQLKYVSYENGVNKFTYGKTQTQIAKAEPSQTQEVAKSKFTANKIPDLTFGHIEFKAPLSRNGKTRDIKYVFKEISNGDVDCLAYEKWNNNYRSTPEAKGICKWKQDGKKFKIIHDKTNVDGKTIIDADIDPLFNTFKGFISYDDSSKKINLSGIVQSPNYLEQTQIAKVEEPKQEEFKPEDKDIDNDAPVIEIAEAITVDSQAYTLKGKVKDKSRFQLTIDDRPIKVAKNGQFEFEGFAIDSKEQLKIVAIDRWKNKSEKIIKVEVKIKQVADLRSYEKPNPSKIKVNKDNNKIGIIIGIEKYQNLNNIDAPYANRDAKAFKAYANIALGIPNNNLKVLIDEDATRGELLKSLKIWLPQITRGKEKDIYIFFAGHGLASDDGKDLHILPHNGDPILLEDTALSRIQMFDLINKVSPKSVTMFFDTCYSGQTRSEQMLIAGLRPVRIVAEEQDTPNNFTIFTASNYDQTSGSINEAEHGIFSYYLMKGLEGNADANKDKKLTNGELIAYLKNNVSQEAFTQNRSQEPMLAGDPDKVLMSYR